MQFVEESPKSCDAMEAQVSQMRAECRLLSGSFISSFLFVAHDTNNTHLEGELTLDFEVAS